MLVRKYIRGAYNGVSWVNIPSNGVIFISRGIGEGVVLFFKGEKINS